MKHFWILVNVLCVAFGAWSGYWAVAPERAYDRGFIQSVVPVGSGYPPIGFSCLVVFLMFAVYSFILIRRACHEEGTFRQPSWARNPFRGRSDPLQAFAFALIVLFAGTFAASLRFLFGATLGLGGILFLWSWDIGILLGALIAYG